MKQRQYPLFALTPPLALVGLMAGWLEEPSLEVALAKPDRPAAQRRQRWYWPCALPAMCWAPCWRVGSWTAFLGTRFCRAPFCWPAWPCFSCPGCPSWLGSRHWFLSWAGPTGSWMSAPTPCWAGSTVRRSAPTSMACISFSPSAPSAPRFWWAGPCWPRAGWFVGLWNHGLGHAACQLFLMLRLPQPPIPEAVEEPKKDPLPWKLLLNVLLVFFCYGSCEASFGGWISAMPWPCDWERCGRRSLPDLPVLGQLWPGAPGRHSPGPARGPALDPRCGRGRHGPEPGLHAPFSRIQSRLGRGLRRGGFFMSSFSLDAPGLCWKEAFPFGPCQRPRGRFFPGQQQRNPSCCPG